MLQCGHRQGAYVLHRGDECGVDRHYASALGGTYTCGGTRLIEAVYEKAKAAGASRVHWLTQFENARAQILYDEVADRSGFMQYRKIF